MIVALLTCVYVIYLYKKLNSEPHSIAKESVGSNQAVSESSVLSDRLSAIEHRLAKLAKELTS